MDIQQFYTNLMYDEFDTPCIFFGDNTSEVFDIIYGVYQGLLKYKFVSLELLTNCFLTNRLDELIHIKYRHRKSRYYVDFLKKQIKIGQTNKNTDDKPTALQIFDDDHCSSCLIKGYITYNYCIDADISPPDCCVCLKNICKACKGNFDNKMNSYRCKTCK